ncbi:unnamed protein product [Linum trigynum]|uniref:DUF4283 domain-containing protein n=1 Tax=Linum trigynum TaxID=586398 RepID=A0AAV2CCQ3_9ROSI
MQIVDLEQGYFLAKFSNASDYTKALTEGPWTIFEHYLVVRKWSPSFRITEKLPPSLIVWVRFPAMPIQYYHTSILTAIGNMIGKLIKIDFHTQTAQRGKFARIAIEIDVSKPLIPDFYLDDCLQMVEYENLPNVCFSCGRINHGKDDCANCGSENTTSPFITRAQTSIPNHQPLIPTKILSSTPSTQQDSTILKSMDHQSELATTDSGFGPWMIVKRKPRRANKNKPPTLTTAAGIPATSIPTDHSTDKFIRAERSHSAINSNEYQIQRREKGNNSPVSASRDPYRNQHHAESSQAHASSKAASQRHSVEEKTKGGNHTASGLPPSLAFKGKVTDDTLSSAHFISSTTQAAPPTNSLPQEKGFIGLKPTSSKAHEFTSNPSVTDHKNADHQPSTLPLALPRVPNLPHPPTINILGPNETNTQMFNLPPLIPNSLSEPKHTSTSAVSRMKKPKDSSSLTKKGTPIATTTKAIKIRPPAKHNRRNDSKERSVTLTLQEIEAWNSLSHHLNRNTTPRSAKTLPDHKESAVPANGGFLHARPPDTDGLARAHVPSHQSTETTLESNKQAPRQAEDGVAPLIGTCKQDS